MDKARPLLYEAFEHYGIIGYGYVLVGIIRQCFRSSVVVKLCQAAINRRRSSELELWHGTAASNAAFCHPCGLCILTASRAIDTLRRQLTPCFNSRRSLGCTLDATHPNRVLWTKPRYPTLFFGRDPDLAPLSASIHSPSIVSPHELASAASTGACD